jgi:glycosyltransferase involved in cell wall biosynthesis
MSMDIDARELLHRLGVPFDVTVHDYFAICPQVNLLPLLQGRYCGEPDIATCNACIANRPSHGARDIVSWRTSNTWQFLEAERVFCASEDVRDRLSHYGLDKKAIVVPHEPIAGPWKLSPRPVGRGPLRVAVIGVLAYHKGAVSVLSVASICNPARLSIHVIGRSERELPQAPLKITGEYQEAQLPALIAKLKPHVLWLPAQWPETYSYTLSAAIDSGLPIVASNIGALPERCRTANDVAGRPAGISRGVDWRIREGPRGVGSAAQNGGQTAQAGCGLLCRNTMCARPRYKSRAAWWTCAQWTDQRCIDPRAV